MRIRILLLLSLLLCIGCDDSPTTVDRDPARIVTGGTFYYSVRNLDDSYSIRSVNPDSGTARRVIADAVLLDRPSRNRLMYRALTTPLNAVVVSDFNGANTLTRTTKNHGWMNASLSPDGSTVAMYDATIINFLPLDGGPETALLNAFGAPHVAYSPDGRSIALSAGTNLSVITIDSARLLLNFHTGRIDAMGACAWSPSGRTIAFAGEASRTGSGSVIYLFDTATKQAVPIDSGATAFAWSPDGSHIALATSNGLVSLDVAKRTTVLLANIPIAPGSEIGWSPNGNWVHFTIEEAGMRTIEMVNVTYTNTFVRLGVSDQPGYWGR